MRLEDHCFVTLVVIGVSRALFARPAVFWIAVKSLTALEQCTSLGATLDYCSQLLR